MLLCQAIRFSTFVIIVACSALSIVLASGPFRQTTWMGQENREKSFVNSVGMKFVLVPSGTFLMGYPPKQDSNSLVNRNGSLRNVTLTQDFHMSAFEVTVAQWNRVMGGHYSSERASGLATNGDCPITGVTWYECMDFCKRLTAKEKRNYRLPTTAEWEYACRCGLTEDVYGHPNEIAWYIDNSSDRLHPVGLKRPNVFGLYDMLGNAWEWCLDWSEHFYNETPNVVTTVVDPNGPLDGRYKTERGGSYCDPFVNASEPSERLPDGTYEDLGFRVVVVEKPVTFNVYEKKNY